jgi:hypothetical protein
VSAKKRAPAKRMRAIVPPEAQVSESEIVALVNALKVRVESFTMAANMLSNVDREKHHVAIAVLRGCATEVFKAAESVASTYEVPF